MRLMREEIEPYLFKTISDPEIPILVHPQDISCFHPSLRECLLGCFAVANITPASMVNKSHVEEFESVGPVRTSLPPGHGSTFHLLRREGRPCLSSGRLIELPCHDISNSGLCAGESWVHRTILQRAYQHIRKPVHLHRSGGRLHPRFR